ncbi:hypothetical protein OE88DRAFT_735416 [Heliocybe sulcata]|uniref:Uncharacterized protein n=1 Tax=Heliocybe sulcata TaxID=5364 RepID=A0A5C3MR04_9AGAM|nr:hypothetical protein OE88DRAFT_735416 [Heliocybe sulcata]
MSSTDSVHPAVLHNFDMLFSDCSSDTLTNSLRSTPESTDFFSWVEGGMKGSIDTLETNFYDTDWTCSEGQSASGSDYRAESATDTEGMQSSREDVIPLSESVKADYSDAEVSEEASTHPTLPAYSRRVVPVEAFGRRFLAYEATPFPHPPPKLLAECSDTSLVQDVRPSQFMLTGFRYLTPEPQDKLGFVAPELSPVIRRYLSRCDSPRRDDKKEEQATSTSKKQQSVHVHPHPRKACHKKPADSVFRRLLDEAAQRAAQREKIVSVKPLASKLKSCLSSTMSGRPHRAARRVWFLEPSTPDMFAALSEETRRSISRAMAR